LQGTKEYKERIKKGSIVSWACNCSPAEVQIEEFRCWSLNCSRAFAGGYHSATICQGSIGKKTTDNLEYRGTKCLKDSVRLKREGMAPREFRSKHDHRVLDASKISDQESLAEGST
jgi:hypothetical protein